MSARPTSYDAHPGLEFRTVAPPAADGVDPHWTAWVQGVQRGFHEARGGEEHVRRWGDLARAQDAVCRGAYPEQVLVGDNPLPVATFMSWDQEVNVGDGRMLPLHMITDVTVAPPPRRQGLLSTLMGEDLRAAADAGLPLAALTVSEGSIYGRFGFGVSTRLRKVEVDTGPRFAMHPGAGVEVPGGRLEMVEPADLFTYEPGQHVSIRAVVEGEDVRRTYSIYPARSEKRLAVGIKRSPGGQFSSYAVDRLRVGDVLGVAPPTGRFSVPLEESLARHHVGIAGGSGVGPVLSVLATTLEEEPLSRFTLLHANRDAASRMFTADLERLAAAHPGRLQVLDVLEDTHGRLDLPMLRGWVEDGTLAEVDAWFVCGPDAMADAVTAALGDLGVDPGSVHAESYTPGAARAGEMSAEAAAHADATLSFVLGGEELSVPVAGRTVLDAALATGRDVPWSCRSGLCGTCQARLCSGSVEMAHNDVLSDAEIDAGLILTCQSRPTSDAVRVDYDR